MGEHGWIAGVSGGCVAGTGDGWTAATSVDGWIARIGTGSTAGPEDGDVARVLDGTEGEAGGNAVVGVAAGALLRTAAGAGGGPGGVALEPEVQGGCCWTAPPESWPSLPRLGRLGDGLCSFDA